MPNLINEIKILIRHGSVYGVAVILSRIIGFLMIPFYTHYLSPEDYGINALVGLTIDIIDIIIGLGIADAIYRFYFDKETSRPDTVVSTACVGVPVISFIVLVCLTWQSKNIASIVLDGKEHWPIICFAFGGMWFNQQISLVATYLRLKKYSGIYLLLSVSRLLITLLLNIYFIAFLKMGVLGIFLSSFISGALFSLITFPILLKKVGFRFSFSIGKKMLRFSLPIIPANLASLAVNSSDRFFIKEFISLADAGIYSLGYRLGSVVFYFVRVPFMQIWGPRRYELYKEGADTIIYSKLATYFIALMIFVGLGISVFVQDAVKIMCPMEYWSAALYSPAIVVCYIIYAMDQFVGFGILIKKKTEYWTYVNLITAGINLALNFLLIPSYGAWGAVFATFFSLSFKITGLHMIAKNFLYIPFEWLRMSGFLIAATLIYLISIIIHPTSLLMAIAYDIFLVFMFIPLTWISGLINHEEKEYILRWTKQNLQGFILKRSYSK